MERRMNWPDRKDLIEQMSLVRETESIVLGMRKSLKIPLKLKLLELQVDIYRGSFVNGSTDRVFLLKDFCYLLGAEDGTNVDEVNPFIINHGFGHWEQTGKMVKTERGTYTIIVKLCTVITPRNAMIAAEKKDYQRKMSEAKKAGDYDENTYKKFKKYEKDLV
jgi:hypothetical protein